MELFYGKKECYRNLMKLKRAIINRLYRLLQQ